MGNVSYHDFYGVLVDKAEREIIVKNLGSNHVGLFFLALHLFFQWITSLYGTSTFLQVMFLRNHGLVVVGRTVEEAFTRVYHTVLACEAQITMMSAGLENLIIVSEEAKQRSMVS